MSSATTSLKDLTPKEQLVACGTGGAFFLVGSGQRWVAACALNMFGSAQTACSAQAMSCTCLQHLQSYLGWYRGLPLCSLSDVA